MTSSLWDLSVQISAAASCTTQVAAVKKIEYLEGGSGAFFGGGTGKKRTKSEPNVLRLKPYT